MKNKMVKLVSIACAVAVTVSGISGCGTDFKPVAQETEFTPSLDTDKSVEIGISGYMANFEALDQVINDFNEFYPNVSICYEQNAQNGLVDYLDNTDYNDIFMTSEINVRAEDQPDAYAYDWCEDLAQDAFHIDTSAIEPELVKACTVDGRLVRIPITKLMCGIVVNEDLLKENGLKIPQTYEEFLDACKVLKDNGYTPIQASKYHAYSDLMLPMGMAIIGNDKELNEKAMSGDTSYAEALAPVFERLQTLIDNGYLDYSVNETYPDDNYDQAILKFFEGDVPFWVATTECFSGMKKRRSKSEAFTAHPFTYKFVNAPTGDEGCFDYEEPWYGFSLNKESKNKDYAAEFLRFMAREEELNTLAEIKGMPSVATLNKDEWYAEALKPAKMQARYVYNGELNTEVTAAIADACNKMGAGDIASVDEAIAFIETP